MRRSVVLLAFCLALTCAAPVYAHGTIYDVTSPICPARPFYWVFAFYGVAFVVLNTWLVRRAGGEIADGLVSGIWGFVLFWLVCSGIGLSVDMLSNGYLPSFGGMFFGRAFFGARWMFLPAFVFWNAVALFILGIVLKSQFARSWAGESAWSRCLRLNVGLYVLALAPFLATGVTVQGWHGYYVYTRCRQNMREISGGVVLEALDNNRRLPDSTDIRQLVAIAERHKRELPHSITEKLTAVCPAGKMLYRHPKPYVWNPEVAGKALDEVEWGTALLTCPYHGNAVTAKNPGDMP